jgi:hypothetical protein
LHLALSADTRMFGRGGATKPAGLVAQQRPQGGFEGVGLMDET